MRKTLITLLLAALLLFSFGAMAAEPDLDEHFDEDGVALENPMHDVETFEELCAAVPGAKIANAPEGATDIFYCWIHTEPVIAQIQFFYGDDAYTYRATALADSQNPVDIDGLYLDFDLEEKFDNLFPGDNDLFTVHSKSDDTYVMIDWVRADANTQYTLFSETAGETDMRIMDVIAKLLPAGDNWTITPNE